MARSLVDTNVLVYSRDLNEPVKRARAVEVIDQLRASGELVLSAQCLNEVSSTSLRRGTPISEVRIAVSRWHDLGDVLPFRGGTALYKLHLKPAARYSEDIDLVQTREEPAGPMMGALREALDPWLGPALRGTLSSAPAIRRLASEDDERKASSSRASALSRGRTRQCCS